MVGFWKSPLYHSKSLPPSFFWNVTKTKTLRERNTSETTWRLSKMPFTWRLLNTSLRYLVVWSDPQRGEGCVCGFQLPGWTPGPYEIQGYLLRFGIWTLKNIRIKHRENLRRYGWMSKRDEKGIPFGCFLGIISTIGKHERNACGYWSEWNF